ncbi:hypothetical protein BDB00DRAFT_794374 [Zychaea mexicana]|uniref:uncharacterized protein n=1 Tax=Zychaea mexicana TaxID=64656 RepID=UPI0022FF00A7|nr:uncharacterized protein BDB00DRAFT_794374 [Zychaea mexicana]KAI9499533.1 hypothetical protein BDB00DRAFT_794374 [Zychaea mexicana]
MCPASQSEEGLHLPPISVIDDFLPARSWQPQIPPPPSPSPQPPLPSIPQQHPQQPSPWLPLSHNTPFQPVITPASSSSRSSPPSTSSSSSTPVARSRFSPPVYHDVDQIIEHCHYLCKSIGQRRSQWTDDDDPKPWLDDMIGRANEVLNALLRLRKQQTARPQLEHPIRSDRPTTTVSSPPTTTAAWHTGTLSLTKLRQRRRGKSATFQGRCHSCNISETPEWRRGPDGARTLCNACGLHYAKLTRKKAQLEQQQQQQQQQQQRQQQQQEQSQPQPTIPHHHHHHHHNMSSSYR